ncbi:MAG TPA: adenylate/guanylate cyclase domain-containing protein, partial [Pirellulaceae bacterium]
LHQRPFREPDKRIQALSRLPDVIHHSASGQDLFQRLVNLLLGGIERADAAAVISVEQGDDPAAADAAVSVLHGKNQLLAAGDFRPSRRLVRQAVTSGQSVAYVWGHDTSGSQADFTSSGQSGWAICTPITTEATPGWALYAAGNFDQLLIRGSATDPELLHDDVKYTEIMAATLGGLLESRQLAARQASLSQFFSPVVLDVLRDANPEQVLAPREADLTVLFCDLRGFTSESERFAHDLFGLLHRVSGALGVMTRAILNQGGVIGDFHGDAAMGFWGWPIAQPDAAIRACRAALDIRAHFEQTDSCAGDAAAGAAASKHKFHVGIGIASGQAVAGKIGTADQVKVTAFGPVVNLAARLETMTRQLPASILVDSLTANSIRAAIGPNICRIRRLIRVLPVGLSAPIDVSEVLPLASDCPDLSDEDLALYESALAAFETGGWHQAGQLLAKAPHADQAKDLLLQFVLEHDGAPPPGWDGAIRLATK